MSDIERIDQRLSAVERAVVDGDVELDQLADLAALAENLERLERRVENHEQRIAELEGTVDSIGGFVGNVESVNAAVETQADAAVAAVDRLEYRIDELEAHGDYNGRTDGDDTDQQTEPNLPVVENAAVNGRSGGKDHTAVVSTRSTDSTATAASDAPGGRPENAEETAGKLLDGPTGGAEAGDADGSSSSRGVQQAIERRVSDSADESVTDGSLTDDGATLAADEDDDSNTLLGSVRDRLP